MNKQGGDSTCEVRLDLPETTGWSTDPIVRTYDAYTEYAPTHRVNCPSQYRFVRWESDEDSDIHGWRETSHPDFELTQNTTATAVFEKVVVPDEESTIWEEHLQSPHLGDRYWHKVSLSSDPDYSFEGITINEDFLPSEMDTSGTSMTLSQQQKEQFQMNWDGSWKIDGNNYRADLDGDPDGKKFDDHGFNPNISASVWSSMEVGDVFKLKQRMRVVGCVSVNNEGPWFVTHELEYKVTMESSGHYKLVFVKKSGVQGPGDPSF
ncbi:MAG: hypothetical protein KF886_16150 [Candidatus Hydrogenedentes bacterium]|nr:hypothetical protein [Candidatus Hydrogenedentota bacterium]